MTLRGRPARRAVACAAVTLLAATIAGCAGPGVVGTPEGAVSVTVAAPLPSARAVPPAPVAPAAPAAPAAPEPEAEVAAPEPATSPPLSVAAAADIVFALANEDRVAAGLAPLTRSADLDAVAQAWSMHLATDGLDLAHNPDFSTQIPGGWSQAAENVGWMGPSGMSGEDVAAQINASWMASEGHRANLLNPALTHIGIGVVDSPDHGWYLTQNFAAY